MSVPDLSVWLVAAYALVLLGVAWLVDVLGSRSARRSLNWRQADFVYHDDVDGWKCHEDQWLWPTAFDPDKRVIRYEGAHAICGRCPSKDTCSPTPGPREITKPVDPWPYSEAGRFHRGVALVIATVGCFLCLFLMVLFRGAADRVLLGATFALMLGGTYPLARHLWSTPDNAPKHLPHLGSAEHVAADAARRAAAAGPVPVNIGEHPSGYRSVREAAERIAQAQGEARSTGRAVKVSFLRDGAAAEADPTAAPVAAAAPEPELAHLAAVRSRKGRFAGLGGAVTDDATGVEEPRRSWASAWNPATTTSTSNEESLS